MPSPLFPRRGSRMSAAGAILISRGVLEVTKDAAWDFPTLSRAVPIFTTTDQHHGPSSAVRDIRDALDHYNAKVCNTIMIRR